MNTSRHFSGWMIGILGFWVVIQVAFAAAAFAQYNPVGAEFRINTNIANAQLNPSVAGLSGGGFVVTWQSNLQDGSEWGVYGQILDSSGTKVGSEFRVNTYTNNWQGGPSVVGLPGNGFVVIWVSRLQDGSDDGIYGQIFNSSGTKVGNEFRVNTYTTQYQFFSRVAGLTGGGFVVTWAGEGLGGSFGYHGQIFNSSGTKVGNQFKINTYNTNTVGPNSVAGLSGGGFVVSWLSDAQDGSGEGVYGQVFNSSGSKVGSEFRVNTYTTNDQNYPSVAGLTGGGFVVTWHSNGQDGSGEGVYGQVFSSSGTKVGSEFRVNTYTTGAQEYPSVAGLSGGGFVVTWHSDGQDGSGEGVYGQVFNSSGTKVGSEFRVNTYTSNDQGDSSVGGLSGDEFVVAWASNGQDGSNYGVYGQRFSLGGETSKGQLVVDFGAAYGLWHYDHGESQPWSQLNTVSPELMTAVDIDSDGEDELVLSFQGYGLYTFEPASSIWTQITAALPEAMIRHGNGIACDFGASHGLWLWDWTEGWKQINSVDPDKMIATDIDGDGKDELLVSFVGYGLYIYDEATGWTGITNVIPEAMIGIN